jgi:hypothetical protein
VFRCEVKYLSRGKGQSTLAAAAYRMAESLREDLVRDFDLSLAHAAYITAGRYEESGPGTVRHDYSRRVHGVRHTEICLPDGAPAWMNDAQALFSAVEAAERRKDARTAVELVVSAPRELSGDGFLDCVRSIVNERVDRHGVAALIAIHETKASDGGVNRHAHCLLTTRAVDGGSATGFAARKVEGYDKRAFIQGIRHEVCHALNWQLEHEDHGLRLDHRRLSVQLEEALAQRDFEKAALVDRLPEPKMGKAAAKLEARGIESERGKLLRQVREINQQRAACYGFVAGLGDRAKGTFVDLRRSLGDCLQSFRAFSTNAREWLTEKALGREAVRRQVERAAHERETKAEPADERARVHPPAGGKRDRVLDTARWAEAAVMGSNLPAETRGMWIVAVAGLRREAGQMNAPAFIAIDPAEHRRLERLREEMKAEARLDMARRGIGPAREMARAERENDAGYWRPLTAEEAAIVGKAVRDAAADRFARRQALERRRERQQPGQGVEMDWREAARLKRQRARDRDRGHGMDIGL